MKWSLLFTLLAASTSAHARRGGGEGGAPRSETITCGLVFAGSAAPEAGRAQLVQNGQALLRGDARGVAYAFSVRGKTAVARLTTADQVVTAQGAIEMLRRGGEANPVSANGDLKRRGEDDANDGAPEREAGLQLSIASAQSPQRPLVTLKCESVNQTPTP